jgi:putative colanic acid biosynthesis acetyltransferase WcaF
MNNIKQSQQQRTHQYIYEKNSFIIFIWLLVRNIFFTCSPQFMYGWRNFILRLFGATIGQNVLIRPTVRITRPWKVKIGDFCRLGDHVVLDSLETISIGNNTVISQRSYLSTRDYKVQKDRVDLTPKPITIAAQVWIATDVLVAAGLSIGTGCIVGVRSTVLNDLPEGMICYGNPAIPIKPRVLSNSLGNDN